MKLNLEPDKEIEPIDDRITIPSSKSRKDRYYRLVNELHVRKKKKLHDLVRERIDELLDEVEATLAG